MLHDPLQLAADVITVDEAKTQMSELCSSMARVMSGDDATAVLIAASSIGRSSSPFGLVFGNDGRDEFMAYTGASALQDDTLGRTVQWTTGRRLTTRRFTTSCHISSRCGLIVSTHYFRSAAPPVVPTIWVGRRVGADKGACYCLNALWIIMELCLVIVSE